MENNKFIEKNEVVPEPKTNLDSKGDPILKTSPDEVDPDYIQPEEESGIIGSGKDQMSEDEFADFMSKNKKE